MDKATADAITMGDLVREGDTTFMVTSISLNGMNPPYFRGNPDGGLVSYKLVQLVKKQEAP